MRLLFGAVDEACTVWVNGQKVLQRPYPFQGHTDSWREAFEIDVTRIVRSDRPNTLAVRVEDRVGAGGIWRPVWLAVSDAPAGEDRNLIGNGGFERGETGWLQHVQYGKFDFAIDKTEFHNGQASARLTCTELVAPVRRTRPRAGPGRGGGIAGSASRTASPAGSACGSRPRRSSPARWWYF